MDIATFIQTLANAVVASSVYALIAVGLAIAFGVMKMANFAHGEFFTLGAYTVYVVYGIMDLPYPIAVILAMPVVAVVGMITERLIFRPTRQNMLAGFMATAGLAFIIQVAVGRIWGVGMPKSIPTPYMGAAHLGDVSIGWQRVIVIPIAFGMLLALRFFLYRTGPGKALRACSQDPEVASLHGINIGRMSLLAMALAGASAGLAGALMAPIHSITPYMGHNVILIAFVVVVVGGMASIEGAVLAAILLGFIHTFIATLADGTTATIVGVAFMALTLVIRPQGLMGRESE
jgi:branched-chain amino acid transport system permease protein